MPPKSRARPGARPPLGRAAITHGRRRKSSLAEQARSDRSQSLGFGNTGLRVASLPAMQRLRNSLWCGRLPCCGGSRNAGRAAK
jgi:hypothetical protein